MSKPRIIRMFPPNIKVITRAFPQARKVGVIFTYGNTIFAPHLKPEGLPPELIEHECVHIQQQEGVNPDVWWAMYIGDPKFRLGMEIPAHKAELDWLRNHGREFQHVPERLLGGLYGNVLPPGSDWVDALQLLDSYTYGRMGVIPEPPSGSPPVV